MINASFQSTGLDSLIQDLDGFARDLNKEVAFDMNENMTNVQIHARGNHRFTSREGKLEQSVQVEYDGKTKNVHKAKIFLNDEYTTTDSGKSYGVFIHEGTYQGYKKSKIAASYPHSTSTSGKGWKSDPFLWKAIDKKWKLTKSLKKTAAKLKKKYSRV